MQKFLYLHFKCMTKSFWKYRHMFTQFEPFFLLNWRIWNPGFKLNLLSPGKECHDDTTNYKDDEYSKQCTLTDIISTERRNYYSNKKTSILNISSYRDWNLFRYAKNLRKLWRSSNNKSLILKIVLKFDQLMQQFNFTIKF